MLRFDSDAWELCASKQWCNKRKQKSVSHMKYKVHLSYMCVHITWILSRFSCESKAEEKALLTTAITAARYINK